MTLTYHKLTELKPIPYNPRLIKEENFIALVRSIEKFGLVQPIVINTNKEILGGNMRFRACQQLRMESVPCIEVNYDSETNEKELNLTLNNKANQGEFIDTMVAELLEELKIEDDYAELRLDELEPLDLSTTELPIEESTLTEPESDTMKLPKLNITFQSEEDKENAKAQIEEIVYQYQGAYIK